MTLKISTDNIQTSTLASLASVSIPKITSITYPGDDTAATTAGGQTITLTGSGFIAGASVIVDGSYAGVVTVVSNTSITFTAPANSGGTYPLYVVNTDGGTAIAIPGISYSGTPSWSNTAGSLATVYETAALSTQLTATGDAAITYSVYSGTLPPGSSLNTSTGLLSGTTQATASSTTYTFTIRATDAQNQDTDRTFSITINPDVVTWSSPADGTVTELFQDTAMSNVTLSATSVAGQSIAYTANALPTGVTISGSNVTGTPTVLGNTISVITATAANTNRTATRTFTWVVSVSSDAFFKNTTLLLNGEGTSANNGSNNNVFIDSSNNNFTITRNGNTSQGTFSPYSVTGWSNYFDGGTNRLTTATSPVFNLTGANITLECWVYMTAAPSVTNRLITIGPNDALSSLNFEISTGRVFGVSIPKGGAPNIGSGSTLVPLNTWTHLAFTLSGSTGTIYINGTQVGQVAGWSITSSVTNYFYIGYDATETVDGKFTGYISNVRLLVGTALYTSAFTPSTTPLTAIANTSLLTCQSNRLIDNSINNFTLTRAGNVSVQAFSPFGSVPEAVPISYSTYLNGSSYVTVPSTSADSLFGSGNYTVEFWTKTDDTSWEMIAPETGVGLALIIASGNLILQNQYGQAGILTVSASSILNNAWHHVAVVRNSGTITIYFDGTSVGTVANSTDYSNQNLTYDIGYGNQSAGRYLSGKLSNFRIVNGTAVYTSNFTPPSTPLTNITNTKVLTFQNPTLIDNSSSARSLGVSGTQNIFIDNPFGYTAQSSASYTPSLHGGSAYFDGTGDYINAGSSASVNMTGDFTVEMWIYGTNTSWTGGDAVGATCLVDTRDQSNATENNRLTLSVNSTGSYPSFYNAGTNTSTASTIPANVGMWNHIAYSRSGSTIKIFVNGVQGASFTDSTSFTAARWVIGMFASVSGGTNNRGGFIGYISNHRIINGTARYTTNFTPPTSPLTAITNTSLLLNFTNAGIIDQHSSNVLETVGNAQISTAVKKYNNSSMYFGGTGYLKSYNIDSIRFGTGNFTIELWFYPTKLGAAMIILSSKDNGTSGSEVSLATDYIGSSSTPIYAKVGGADFAGTYNGALINQWTHIALVRNGATVNMYFNGTSIASAAGGTPGNINFAAINIGGGSGLPLSGYENMTGYIDDLRITKGYARYTSNFTAPTSAFTTK
jgi:hypothetical protein